MTEPARDDLHLSLVAHGASLDAEIASSGALARVRRKVLAPRPGNVLAGIPWRRVAAAVLIAGALGGAVDLVLPQQTNDTLDVAVIDPLDALDGADTQ